MTSPNPQDDWTACPPGELARITEAMRSRRARQRRIRTTGVVVGVGCILLLSVAGVHWLQGTGRDLNYGGITCSEVRQQARDYMAGRLEETTARRIRIHLEQCPLCQAYMKEMELPPAADATANAPQTSRLHPANGKIVGGGVRDSFTRPETGPHRTFNNLLSDVR